MKNPTNAYIRNQLFMKINISKKSFKKTESPRKGYCNDFHPALMIYSNLKYCALLYFSVSKISLILYKAHTYTRIHPRELKSMKEEDNTDEIK